MKPVYLNNAAASYPKPQSVYDAVMRSLTAPPSEPGRTVSHRDTTTICRRLLCELFEVPDERQVVLTHSCTHALNTVIAGISTASPGRPMIASRIEHNSVLRPLMLQKQRHHLETILIPANTDGVVDASLIAKNISSDTALVCISHVSNVTGVIQPIEEIAAFAAGVGVPLLIDAAQSAGSIPFSYRRLPGLVYAAFSGHKGLFGPSGVGGLIVPDDSLPQTIVGGTGVRSESLLHPSELPLRHEAGTPNSLGIAGLCAGIQFVLDTGIENIGGKKARLVRRIRENLEHVEGVHLHPKSNTDGRTGIVSLSVDNCSPQELGFTLKEAFDIEVRAGLHCAPLIHSEPGMNPRGTVRIGVGPFNAEDEIDRLTSAIVAVTGGGK